MSDKRIPLSGELSYYGLSLLSFLRGSHPTLADDRSFIAQRAARAAEAYSEAIRTGATHPEAETTAIEELYRSRSTIRWFIFFGTSSPRRFPKRLPARRHSGCLLNQHSATC